MTTCGSGEVLRGVRCVPAGGTAVVSYGMLLLMGLGAIALGVYLQRKWKSAPPVEATEKIIYRVAPYFLMFWGCAAVAGFAGLIAKK